MLNKIRQFFSNKSKSIGILFLCCLFIVSSYFLISKLIRTLHTSDEQEETAEILIPVIKGTIGNSISFVGNLQYSQSSVVSWKTDGVIKNVYVKTGDKVRKNDILAELDPDFLSSSILLSEKTMIDEQEKLEDVLESESDRMQAYADLNAKEIALRDAKLAQEALYYPRSTREEMEIAWDKYALAHLNFNYAKQDYDYLDSINETWEGYEPDVYVGIERIRGGDSRSGRERKFEDYVNTYNELVTAYENYVWTAGRPTNTEYAVAQGNVAVAQMEYDKALEEYLSFNVMPREKDVHAVKVSLDNAEITYKTRYVTAPFDGVITSVNAVESFYVTKGTDAFRIDDMSEIFIPLNISELDISSLINGAPVSIVVDANNKKTYKGHIYSFAEAGSSSGDTNSFNAMVIFDDPDSSLLAGMTAEVKIGINEKKNVLLIPNAAISYIDGKPHVTVVSDNIRYTFAISTGAVSGEITEVTSKNLHEGDLLSVPSITADTLKSLGLDPTDYLPNMDIRPKNFGFPQSMEIMESRPDRK